MTLDWEAMAVVGRVARTHGLRGQLVVNPETDFAEERFHPGSVIYARRSGAIQPLTVTEARMHQGRPIVTFGTISSIDEAGWLAGAELRVPVEALRPLDGGEYYRHDLVGCRVRTAAGVDLGTVVAVEGPREGCHLVVREGGREVLVPLASDICVEIDAPGRRILVEPPAGLLDLNATGKKDGR